MKKIIVLQQNDLLVSMCIDKLRAMLPAHEFAVLLGTRTLHDLIEPDADQFFITGALKAGTDDGVAELIDELRAKNPKLIVGSFCAFALEGDIDVVIEKTRGVEEFAAACRDFLAGRIERKPNMRHKPYLLPVGA